MSDVFVALALVYFTIRPYRNKGRGLVTIGMLGVVAVFLSNVASVMLACCWIVQFLDLFRRDRQLLKYVFLTGAC